MKFLRKIDMQARMQLIFALLVTSCAVSPGSSREDQGSQAQSRRASDKAVEAISENSQASGTGDVDQLTLCEKYLKIEETEGRKVKRFAFVSMACHGDTGIVSGYESHEDLRVGRGDDPDLMETTNLEIVDGKVVTAGEDPVVLGQVRDGVVRGDLPVEVLVKEKNGSYRAWDLEKDFGARVPTEVVLRR